MTVLQVLQRLLVVLDGALQLLDVLGAALAKGGLRLPVALLALFRGGIDLTALGQCYVGQGKWFYSGGSQGRHGSRGKGGRGRLTGLRPPLRFCCCGSSWVYVSARPGSGDDPIESVEPSREASALPTGAVISITRLSPMCGDRTPQAGRGAPDAKASGRRDEQVDVAGGSGGLSALRLGSRSVGSRGLRVDGALIMQIRRAIEGCGWPGAVVR